MSIKKILVIRVDHIGDVLITTPLYKSLKSNFPDSKIYALVGSWAKDVLKYNKNIDTIFIYDAPWWKNKRSDQPHHDFLYLNTIKEFLKIIFALSREKFDLVIDPRGDLRHLFFFGYCIDTQYLLSFNRTGGKYLLSHAVPYNEETNEMDKNTQLLIPLGIQRTDKHVEIFLSHNEIQWANDFVKNNSFQSKNIVVVAPGARKHLKMWPIDKFIALTKWIAHEYSPLAFIFVGAQSDMYLSSVIKEKLGSERAFYNLIGKTNILQLYALLQKCHLIITNDGPIAHMSSSLHAPTIVLFGPTSVVRYKPYGNHIYTISNKCECSPCLLNKCNRFNSEDNSFCMDAIKVDEVKHLIKEKIYF